MLVMATGTGKTFTAFQIIWRLWKSGAKKRILFLADRNILVDQTRVNDFKPFGSRMTKIKQRQVDKSYEIYLSLYQAVTGNEEAKNIYRQFSPDFFDLIIIDECHRGSADEDSAWREILEYFGSATQIGLTATPRETEEVSNSLYFGDSIFTYSLKQGIEDGFLAPYKVIRIDFDKDLSGWKPKPGQRDKYGKEIPDQVFNQRDFDRTLVLEKRTELVARIISDYLKSLGVPLEGLEKEIGQDFDPLDLICHVVFDQPPLTRKERANNVRKRNYFSKYGEQARTVLNALLDKYADEGIEDIESLDVLKVKPISDLGTPLEIIKIFGGKQAYLQALSVLKEELYRVS
ncbi:type I restriction-modification enzyme R subunit [Richelia sinica FACHB-800]|uniref:Type I restriction-modification enzyme R subunit n=1 Tax=Richelia sinica FACHB-800 TaxID=1357546 RepID=A0A975T7N0_9NOST|nr:type I restriction-modification enzyme R subunit [Richelia sinica FACHB-800]